MPSAPRNRPFSESRSTSSKSSQPLPRPPSACTILLMGGLILEIGQTVSAKTSSGVPVVLRTQHEAYLLGALALAAPRELDREKLASELWPQSPKSLAQQNFRQRLSQLRNQLGGRLESDRTAVSLNRSDFQLIIDQSRSQAPDSALRRCQQLVEVCLMPEDAIRQYLSFGWLRNRAEEALESARLNVHLPSSIFDQVAHRIGDVRQPLEFRVFQAVFACSGTTCQSRRSPLLKLIGDLSNSHSADPFLKACLGYLCQRAATIAHSMGQWQRSICFEREAIRHASDSSQPWRADWSRFRLIRKQIDVALTDQNYRALNQLRLDSRLSSELESYIDMNLVHAHALRGDFGLATQAALRCRQRSQIKESPELEVWLHLNEALLSSLAGHPRQAIEPLIEASQKPVAYATACWQWTVAAQVFATLGDTCRTAEFFALAERGRIAADLHLTPTNHTLFHSMISDLAQRAHAGDWLAATSSAEQIPLLAAHDYYGQSLKSARAG